MTQIVSTLESRLAERIRDERIGRGWSTSELSARSGVSRAMVARVEGGAVQPTAALLGRLAGAFGVPLSLLFARAEGAPSRLVRHADQSVWRDPETRYVRRALSPPSDAALQLTLVDLPPGATVRYPSEAYAFIHQQIWVQTGTLTFVEGPDTHVLEAGDCLQLGPPAPCTFANRTRRSGRYLGAVARR